MSKKEAKITSPNECQTCMFWRSVSQTCHVHSPLATQNPQTGEPAFPRTLATDWCGEYQHGEYGGTVVSKE